MSVTLVSDKDKNPGCSPRSCSAACVHPHEPHQSDSCTVGGRCHPATLKQVAAFNLNIQRRRSLYGVSWRHTHWSPSCGPVCPWGLHPALSWEPAEPAAASSCGEAASCSAPAQHRHVTQHMTDARFTSAHAAISDCKNARVCCQKCTSGHISSLIFSNLN